MRVSFPCGVMFGFVMLLLMAGTTTASQKGGQELSLEELKARLQDSDARVRSKTLGYVGAMKPYPNEVAPLVIRLLKDPHFNVRSNAANTLGNLKNALPDLAMRYPECVPQLILMLSDRDDDDKHQLVRRHAAYALRHLGASSKAAVPELLKIALDKKDNAAVRTEAVQALGDIGHASPEVVAALTKLLDDPARINENYPTIGRTASSALGRFKAQAEATRVLIQRLQLPDVPQRAAAAAALGNTGFGSIEAENALLGLLEDKSPVLQKSALSSLEGINDIYAFYFRNNVSSREITERQKALLQEIRLDAERRARFVRILAAQIRLGEGHHPRRAIALQRLVALDGRDQVNMLKEQFAKLEKKTVYLERADLRSQLLIAVAAWLPDKEAVPFLTAVDTDGDEAPQVRFRAAVLLCERGDEVSVAHIVKQYHADAKKLKPLISVEAIQKALGDPALKAEPAEIQKGIQLAQHLFDLRQREAIVNLSLIKVNVNQGKIESVHFRLTTRSEGWSFELLKKGDWWLPCNVRMTDIK